MSTSARIAVFGLLATGIGMVALAAQSPAPPPPAPGGVPATTAAPAPTTAAGQIQFETPVYDFGKVKSGDPVKYTYVFTNTGCGTLEVTHVQPQCGCTTAGDWTKKVEPGQTGTIPIQFNSGTYPAGGVTKNIVVTCNDPAHPQVTLQLKGAIWKPIDFQPAYAMLNVPADGPGAPAVVKVINNMEEPLTLSPPESNNRSVTATLSTNQPGKEFQLTLSAVPPLKPGAFQVAITLKTSATNMPTLNIPLWVNVAPAVTVIPAQVFLPPGPLAAQAMPSIRIENKSTNHMQLSVPAVNAEGVDIQIKELQPNRMYDAQLTFPAGFQIAQGQRITFTAKSGLEQFPLIEVPINQQPSPPVPVPPKIPTPTAPGVGAPTLPPRPGPVTYPGPLPAPPRPPQPTAH
jgi:hypothetical protein